MRYLLPLFLLACQDYTLEGRKDEESGGPGIEVTPNPVQFGNLPAGEQETSVLTITSVGSTTLTVENIAIYTGDMFSITAEGLPGRLPPGESMEAIVTWTSTGVGDAGQALVLSDDPANLEVYVDLLTGAALPDLVIDPEAVDFGAVMAGSSVDATVTLRNVGEGPLEVTDIAETENVFSHSGLSLPFTIDAGSEADLTVTFAPTAEGNYSGLLEVMSNDPDGLETATLNGEVGSQPIAVCEVTPDTVEAISEDADFIGENSYDPSGYSITRYDWQFVSLPAGSAASMPSGTGANRRGFTPDVVGTYVAQLVVTNSIGAVSEPCEVELEAIPGGDFWIEMFWTHGGDDMDLHLLAPGGAVRNNTTDCYYANCVGSGLDWGTRGDATDNPSLDLDDIPGTGPENINISDPSNGTFTVVVNDYPGSSYTSANSVTVNVYVGGVLEWTDTRNISGENTDEEFCEVTFPGGTVTPL